MGFKVGDKVRLTGDHWSDELVGSVFPVADVDEAGWAAISPPGLGTVFAETSGPWAAEVVESGESPIPDATKPNYYEFPGGIQPLDLSQHLTHAGGSALDYIARSCRADGVFKSDRIGDLEKAKVWIDVEIARLRYAVERD